jgi:hypothetical protein
MSEEQVKEHPVGALSPEEQEELLQKARELIATDEKVNLLATVMIYAPRIYQLARGAFRQVCEEQGHKWEDGMEEMILQATQHAAQTAPYSRQDVMRIMSTAMIKFISEECETEAKQVQEQQRVEQEAAVKELKETPVPYPALGTLLDAHRGDVIVFVGESHKVEEALDEVMGDFMESFNEKNPLDIIRVLHLAAETKNSVALPRKEHNTKRILHLGVNQWVAMANKGDGISQTLLPFYRWFTQGRADAIVVSDGYQLFTGGLGGAHPLFSARDGIKRLRNFAREVSAIGFVGLAYDSDDREEFMEYVYKLLSEHYIVHEVQ